MKTFWAWMKYKKYIEDIKYENDIAVPYLRINARGLINLTKQMLVGYMFEYLMERYKDAVEVDLGIGSNIEEFYESLKKNILELDR